MDSAVLMLITIDIAMFLLLAFVAIKGAKDTEIQSVTRKTVMVRGLLLLSASLLLPFVPLLMVTWRVYLLIQIFVIPYVILYWIIGLRSMQTDSKGPSKAWIRFIRMGGLAAFLFSKLLMLKLFTELKNGVTTIEAFTLSFFVLEALGIYIAVRYVILGGIRKRLPALPDTH